MTIYAEYHDDGGQMCVRARAKLDAREAALALCKRSHAWGGGHFCRNSAGIFETDEELPCGILSHAESVASGWGTRWQFVVDPDAVS